jgi:hypothetical protein
MFGFILEKLILIIATDITERKIASDKLKSSIPEKEILIKDYI